MCLGHEPDILSSTQLILYCLRKWICRRGELDRLDPHFVRQNVTDDLCMDTGFTECLAFSTPRCLTCDGTRNNLLQNIYDSGLKHDALVYKGFTKYKTK